MSSLAYAVLGVGDPQCDGTISNSVYVVFGVGRPQEQSAAGEV